MSFGLQIGLIAYVIIGAAFAAVLWMASTSLTNSSSRSQLPWLTKLLFPLHVNFVNLSAYDEYTWGTLFWNRSTYWTSVGVLFAGILWPLRLGGSLLGWSVILLIDLINWMITRFSTTAVSRQ